MRGTVAKRLNEQARLAAKDGSVVKSHEYNRLKKSYNKKHYAPVVVMFPSKPGEKFTGKFRKANPEKFAKKKK